MIAKAKTIRKAIEATEFRLKGRVPQGYIDKHPGTSEQAKADYREETEIALLKLRSLLLRCPK